MKTAIAPDAEFVAEFDAFIDRMHDACLTMVSLPPDGPRRMYSTWPAYRLEWWDAEIAGSKRQDESITKGLIAAPRFFPTARQIDDCLPMLALMDGVERRDRRIVAMRAVQLWYAPHDAGSWRRIGASVGLSHEGARKIHYRTMRSAFMRFRKLPDL